MDLADCEIDTTCLASHGLVLPGFGRELPDALLVRGVAGGSLEQITRRLGVLHALRDLGVPVYNDARAIERSVDKSMTSLLLRAAGVPTPPTWATESTAQARRIVMREAAAGHALVLKPLFGSQGKGLQRVGCVDGALVPLPDLGKGLGHVAYLQRYVPPVQQPRPRLACAGGGRPAPWPPCAASAKAGCTTWRRARAWPRNLCRPRWRRWLRPPPRRSTWTTRAWT